MSKVLKCPSCNQGINELKKTYGVLSGYHISREIVKCPRCKKLWRVAMHETRNEGQEETTYYLKAPEQ